MIQVCERTTQVLPARRISAEEFCALARAGGGTYRPRWEVLRMLAVGEAWGAAAPDGCVQAGLLVLPLEADVSLAAALRECRQPLPARGCLLTPPVGPPEGLALLPAALKGALRTAHRRGPQLPVQAVLETGPGLEQLLPVYFAAGFSLRALRPLNTLAPQCLLSTAPVAPGSRVELPLADATHLALLLARGWAAVACRPHGADCILTLAAL